MMILRDLSRVLALFFTLVIFLLLFEPRYSKKKTLIISLATMIPLCIINLTLSIVIDIENFGNLMLLTLSLPSCIVFWVLAKNRDGRFFFTFCMVDSIVLETLFLTQIINFYVTPDSNMFMFLSRLILYSLLVIIIYKIVRPMYRKVQQQIKEGWGLFAIISGLFYVILSLMMTHPTLIVTRPEYIPVMCLMFVLMPVVYIHIISTLRRLQVIHDISEQDSILKLQVGNLTARMDELAVADQQFRVERHNFRHKMNTIAGLLEKEQYDEIRILLEQYTESIKDTQVKRYCKNAVMDAVLSSYLHKAEIRHIKINHKIAFPEQIPVNESELATVFANALENAINACEKLDPEKRFIEINVLNHPRFIVQISNSFDGNIEFDKNGIPVSHESGHGFGTRSIVAFCERNDAFYQFKTSGDKFSLYLNF